ncbi:MAG: lipid II flippase family protein [Ruminiclostridium sp.]
MEGKYSEADFRGCVIGMLGSKILGTALSFFIFIPAAYTIVFVARII